eukprot:COSAG06_NODE_534_length_14525_cov_90.383058_3_plen_209_part_00
MASVDSRSDVDRHAPTHPRGAAGRLGGVRRLVRPAGRGCRGSGWAIRWRRGRRAHVNVCLSVSVHARRGMSIIPGRRGALACLMHTAAYRTDSADTHHASRSTRSSWAIGAWATTGWATLRRRRLRRDRLHTQGPRRLGDRHHGRGPSARCLRPPCLAARSLVRQALRCMRSWDSTLTASAYLLSSPAASRSVRRSSGRLGQTVGHSL